MTLSTTRSAARQVCTHLAKRLKFNSSMWKGDFPNWQASAKGCRSDSVVNQNHAYEHAIGEVLAGKALFERDGLLQFQPATCWPLIYAIQQIRSLGIDAPVLLDFGGGMASVFFQHRQWLTQFPNLRWHVVELNEVVDSAKRRINISNLEFFRSVDDALVSGQPNLILASGIYPMIEDPQKLHRQFADLNPQWLFIDRVPWTNDRGRNLITRQRVPKSIYLSESPFWFFDRNLLLSMLTTEFELSGESVSDFDRPVWVEGYYHCWSGFLMRSKKPN